MKQYFECYQNIVNILKFKRTIAHTIMCHLWMHTC